MKHVIAPYTFNKRGKQFSARGRDYSEWLEEMQAKHFLDFKNVSKTIRGGLVKISRFKNLPKVEILRREALLINRQASYLVDIRIDSAEIGREAYNAMTPKAKSDLWARLFSDNINGIIRHYVKSPDLIDAVEGVAHYLTLPENIHKRRGDKASWHNLKKIRNKLIASGVNPSDALLKEMDRILSKRRPGETYKVKAMDVCVAASIYADILKKTKNKSWTQSYREAMEIVYPKISVDEQLVRAIINLSKANL